MSLVFCKNRLVVYVDGACFDNHNRHGSRKAGWGYFFNHNHPWNSYGPLEDCEPTNNNAEIEAAIQALNKCEHKGYSNVEVRTDSEFLVNSVLNWLPKWKYNGWRKADGTPVRNRQKFMELNETMSGMDIRWVHVPGHDGIDGNEGADKLARKGAQCY